MDPQRKNRWWFIAFEGALTPVSIALSWVFGTSGWSSIVWEPLDLFWGTAAAIPVLVLVAAAFQLRWRPFRSLDQLVSERIVPFFRSWSLAELALVSALAGLGEELLCRGVIQSGLAAKTGPWAALVIVAILFGAVHALNLVYALCAACMGAYLGWLWMASGNLLVPITTHAAYDFVALVYLVRLRA